METMLVVGWMLIGAAIAIVMVRRGHSPALWWVLMCFGPLAALIAIASVRDEHHEAPTPSRFGWRGRGGLSVVVGVDGSAQALEACHRVPELFGPELGSATIVAVVPHDPTGVDARAAQLERAESWVEDAARSFEGAGGPSPQTVVLTGSAVTELSSWATEHEADVIVVCTRSHSFAKHALAGSVARGLAARATCPVLTVPVAHQRSASPATADR